MEEFFHFLTEDNNVIDDLIGVMLCEWTDDGSKWALVVRFDIDLLEIMGFSRLDLIITKGVLQDADPTGVLQLDDVKDKSTLVGVLWKDEVSVEVQLLDEI